MRNMNKSILPWILVLSKTILAAKLLHDTGGGLMLSSNNLLDFQAKVLLL